MDVASEALGTIANGAASADRASFRVRVVGPGSIAAADLADLLILMDGAIVGAGTGPGGSISLVGLDGDLLTFAVDRNALPALASIRRAIASGRFEDLAPAALERLHRISDQATSRGWAIVFEGGPPATISAERPIPGPTPGPIREATTIWGHLQRIGGAKRLRATLRLPSGDPVVFDVTPGMGKRLGAHFHDSIELDGVATRDVAGGPIVDFEVADFRPYRPDVGEIFRQLAELADGRFDGIDPVEYVRQLRGR